MVKTTQKSSPPELVFFFFFIIIFFLFIFYFVLFSFFFFSGNSDCLIVTCVIPLYKENPALIKIDMIDLVHEYGGLFRYSPPLSTMRNGFVIETSLGVNRVFHF